MGAAVTGMVSIHQEMSEMDKSSRVQKASKSPLFFLKASTLSHSSER